MKIGEQRRRASFKKKKSCSFIKDHKINSHSGFLIWEPCCLIKPNNIHNKHIITVKNETIKEKNQNIKATETRANNTTLV